MGDMIQFTNSGSFDHIEKFLKTMQKGDVFDRLEHYGQKGVDALANATPRRSGTTAESWYYEIKKTFGSFQIIWHNRNVHEGRPIAILLQYGHGTGTGGYVQGRDYINPALQPIFDEMADEAWKAVTSA